MSNWINKAKERASKLVDYCEDLENRNKYLRKELAEIAAGLTYVEDNNFPQSTRLQLRASKALAKESEMPNNKTGKYVL